MRDVPIYDAPTRLFHWLFAGFFTVAFAIANLVDDESARFSLHMLAGLARRLQGLVHDVQAYSLHSGTQRVIGYLLGGRSTPEPGSASMTVTLPVSKAAIASRLSITPEYFSRVLGELVSQGLIEVDKREIDIPDVGKLASYQER